MGYFDNIDNENDSKSSPHWESLNSKHQGANLATFLQGFPTMRDRKGI
jgi:hypothetical protein